MNVFAIGSLDAPLDFHAGPHHGRTRDDRSGVLIAKAAEILRVGINSMPGGRDVRRLGIRFADRRAAVDDGLPQRARGEFRRRLQPDAIA